MRKSNGNHPVFLRIILPKGTKAAWIDGITDVGQAELLLAPDAEFEVIQAITRNQKGQKRKRDRYGFAGMCESRAGNGGGGVDGMGGEKPDLQTQVKPYLSRFLAQVKPYLSRFLA